MVGADTVELQTANDPAALDALRIAGRTVKATGSGLIAFVDDGEAAVPALITEAGVAVRTVHVHRPTLDVVFMHFTGREIRDQAADAPSVMARAWRVAGSGGAR